MKNYKVRLNFKNGVTGNRTPAKDIDLITILDEIKQDIDMNNLDWLDNDDWVVDSSFLISKLEFDKVTGNLKHVELLSTKEYIRDPY